MCCDSWGRKESDMTERLNETELDYTIHDILQARILECIDVPFSKESFQPRDQTQVSHIGGRFFTN